LGSPVRFDDRLATVLAQPAATLHDRAVRWRQLVDLVARSGGGGDRALLERAIDSIRDDAGSVREPLRAAAARAIAGAPVPLALLKLFAGDTLVVAAPLLAAAELDGQSLAEVRATASTEVRRFIDSTRAVASEEIGEDLPSAEPTELAAIGEAQQPPTISEMVARIERRRSSRTPGPAPAMAQLPGDDGEPALFRWECSPGGEIEWVEGAPRGPLIGRTIADADPDEGVDECVERAFKVRAPFRDCELDLGQAGLLGGPWTISGIPAFAPGDGRFIGYRGIARRGAPESDQPPGGQPLLAGNTDALREMIHEIKTPLNAIIGFAEIIDGQYFGPAHRHYRERAAQIVGHARLLLDAAEDLDFVARTQAAGPAAPTDLAEFLPGIADRLVARAMQQGVLIDLDEGLIAGAGALNPELTERLLGRFADALISAANPGERLAGAFAANGAHFQLALARPAAMRGMSSERLLDPDFGAPANGERASLAIGFALRLVAGLARLAAGRIEFGEDQVVLRLPLAQG
jgi:hypothetical protein